MHSRTATPSVEWVRGWLISRLAELCGLDPRAVDVREQFSRYGLDSRRATRLIADLAERLGRPLPPILVWEHPTPESLARYLVEGAASSPTDEQRGPAPENEPVAILGMACRFPKAPSVEAFWRLLRAGVDAVTEPPPDRWDADAMYDPDLSAPGKMNTRAGGFLEQVDRFDALFFGISPREAVQMDPQQRLMLELSWEALEDAGLVADALKGSATGVFFGVAASDYNLLVHQGGPAAIVQHTATGVHHSIIANRVSYALGLEGPSMAVDTACSSSLVAVHLACESVRRGESTLALAGGVSLNLIPESTIGMSKFGGLSGDGRCFTFDARANGYVRGEGGGVVVLKRLSRALADGDPILCVVRGSAVNNDGASNGLTAPNPKAQEAMLRAAYRAAGVDPAAVDYVEAHGTGTFLGDPIEAKALGAVLGAGRTAERPLLVGSVKTNIGHLEAAAGVAGLIKVALCIQRHELVPSLHFETPNPHIPFADLHLEVQRARRAWPEANRPPLAGVSAFSFGGTNCHVVLEGFAAPEAELLPLSGASPEALRAAAGELLSRLRSAEQPPSPKALCRAAALCAGAHEHRLAARGRSAGELRDQLEGYLEGHARPGLSARRAAIAHLGKPVFVFSGQGSQWVGMGRSLLQREPVFRASVARCDRLIQRHLGWSLLDELTADKARSRMHEIDVLFPAVVAIEIALADLWRSWGIEPACVVGHSIGEVAAAHVAGVLSLEDAMLVICAQGRLIRRIRGRGAMGLAALPWEQAGAALAEHEGRLCRAIHESPDSTVLAGDAESLTALFAVLERQNIFCSRVNTDVAAHSPQVAAVRAELVESLSGVVPRPARLPVSSSVTGSLLRGERCDAAYWARNLAEPVLFAGAISALLEAGYATFLEVSPHPLVKNALQSCARHAGREAFIASSLRRHEDERAALLDTLGTLYTLGHPVRWEELYPGDGEPAAGSDVGATSTPVGADVSPTAPLSPAGDRPSPRLLPLSARSPSALVALAEAYRSFLSLASPEAPASLRDLAYTAGARRCHHEHRLAVVASSRHEISDALAAFVSGATHPAVARGQARSGQKPKVVFVFPGQGSQWAGMGRELVRGEPAFRAAIEACDEAIARHGGFSAIDVLMGREGSAPLEPIHVVQPVLFAIEVALAALWRTWSVEPAAVVGHSMGEVAAAHVAGALCLDDAARIICRRSRLLRRVSGKGAMALVELTMDEAARELRGHEDRLSVAVSNGPRSTVIAGEPSALEQVLTRLAHKGVFCRRVKVDVASHSPQVDPLLRELVETLEGLSPAAAAVPMRSTVLGREIAGEELVAAYWAQNLRAPVLFSQTVQGLIESDHVLFVEMSPHPILLPAIEEGLRQGAREGAALPSLRRDQGERRVLLGSLGALYAHGCDVAWDPLFPSGGRSVALPTYPWQRERYWVEISDAPLPGRPTGHPLLGPSLASSVQPGAYFWEQALRPAQVPYLLDHRLHGEVLLPGAAFVEMALSAAAEAYGEAPLTLSQVTFERMLLLPEEGGLSVQAVLTEQDGGRAWFQVSSREGGGWARHVTAMVRRGGDLPEPADARETPTQIQKRCGIERSGAEHTRCLEAGGLSFGSRFRGVEQLWLGDGEVLGRVRLPDAVRTQGSPYRLHPALLDACFQVLVGLFVASAPLPEGETYLLTALGRLQAHARPGREVWVHGRARAADGSNGVGLSGDLEIIDDGGQVLVSVEGLCVQRSSPRPSALREPHEDALVAVAWRKKEPLPETLDASAQGTWLLLVDRGGTGSRLSSLLRARGGRCVRVAAGERFARLEPDLYHVDALDPEGLRAVLRDACSDEVAPRGVVHLSGLDARATEDTTRETLRDDLRLGCLSALHVAQTLLGRAWRNPPRLVLVTRGAHAVGAAEAAVSVSQAPLWGLGRTLALEHPELSCTRVDLGPPTDDEALQLTRELLSTDGESELALREDGRYVARLVRAAPPPRPAAGTDRARVRPDATYLITGGFQGIGLAIAAWIAERGARHLALVDDGIHADTVSAAQKAIEAAGATVLALRADASKPEEVARILAEIERRAPPLRGVVHAAEALENGTVLELAATRWREAMAPMVEAAWNLHALTREASLDFFVLCSSSAAILGCPGQASDAAAGALLGALSQHRRALGLSGVSVHWAPLSESSAQAASPAPQQKRRARPSYQGIAAITPAQAGEIFGRLLCAEMAQIGALDLRLRQWIEFHPSAAGAPMLAELPRDDDRPASVAAEVSRLREALSRAQPDARAALLEQHLCEQLGRTLHQDASRIDRLAPFRRLGLESMMALELRNRLEASLALKLSATLLFTYADVASLAGYILRELGLAASTGGAPDRAPGHGAPAGLTSTELTSMEEEIARMSDDRAEQLLLESILSVEEGFAP